MPRSTAQLRSDALAIWQAAVHAVHSDRLVKDNVRVDGDWLLIGDHSSFNPEPQATANPPSVAMSALAAGSRLNEQQLRLASIRRIAVVGAGKAGAGMAAGLEEALGPQILAEKQVSSWINVPADCIPLPSGEGGRRSRPGEGLHAGRIHLHAARPAGVNEPTAEGVFGAERILEIVSTLG